MNPPHDAVFCSVLLLPPCTLSQCSARSVRDDLLPVTVKMCVFGDRHIQRLYEYCRLSVLNAVRQIVCTCRTELPLVRLSCWFIELCCQQM